MSLRKGEIIIAGVTPESSSYATKTELATKANTDLSNCTKPYLKTTYVNGTSGYRIWTDGYCEQWGDSSNNSTSGTSVSFLKTFKDTNYRLLTDFTGNSSGDISNYFKCSVTKNTGSFVWYLKLGSEFSTNRKHIDWRASGYLASGQY